jgi:hypothetical protein
MASASELTEALDEALSGEAASQADKPSTPEVKTEDIVTKAVAEATKTPEAPSDEKTGAKEEKGSKDPVPYDRFSEVIGQKNEALEQVKALEQKYTSSTEREDALRNQLGTLENDHQILEAIRNLSRDERYAGAVNTIDRALQGLEAETEEAVEAGDDKAVQAAEAKFAQQVERLEGLHQEQRNEALFDKSDAFATSLLDTLPDEYTDVDKKRLAEMWSPRVDWATIEEHGAEAIPEQLKSSFADLIRSYGVPQGALEQRVRENVTQEIPEEARPSTPEDVVKGVLEKDWTGTDEDGKPTLTDDQFAADMATILRKTRA